jgi:hypothetical protein
MIVTDTNSPIAAALIVVAAVAVIAFGTTSCSYH